MGANAEAYLPTYCWWAWSKWLVGLFRVELAGVVTNITDCTGRGTGVRLSFAGALVVGMLKPVLGWCVFVVSSADVIFLGGCLRVVLCCPVAWLVWELVSGRGPIRCPKGGVS